MKVGIASVLFLETTFPLAKHLSDQNVDVSVFCIFPMESRNSNVIDFSDYKVKSGFDNTYNDKVFNEKLKQYLRKVKLYSFFYTNLRKQPGLNFLLAVRLVHFFKREHFDIIHFIGSSPFLYLLHLLSGRKKNCFSNTP